MVWEIVFSTMKKLGITEPYVFAFAGAILGSLYLTVLHLITEKGDK